MHEFMSQVSGRPALAITSATTTLSRPFPVWWELECEAEVKWLEDAKALHARWWEARIARQREIDASIAAKAEFEYLYDKPYDDKK